MVRASVSNKNETTGNYCGIQALIFFEFGNHLASGIIDGIILLPYNHRIGCVVDYVTANKNSPKMSEKYNDQRLFFLFYFPYS